MSEVEDMKKVIATKKVQVKEAMDKVNSAIDKVDHSRKAKRAESSRSG